MQDVYKKITTPHKLGAVIKWEDCYTDSPTVFKKDGIFYMYFISIASLNTVFLMSDYPHTFPKSCRTIRLKSLWLKR